MFHISKIFHADHGIPVETLTWAVNEVKPTGFFLRTLTLPEGHADVTNKLHGPACGDAPVTDATVRVRDANDAFRPETPFVDRSPRPSRLLTIIGMRGDGDDGSVTIFTAYGGPAAARVPNDPSLAPGTPEHDEAVQFWSQHALSETT